MYHVMGTPREENRMDSNTISSQLAQTSFDEEVADAEYNVEDEETGFSTPDSNSEKPLSYSYPSPADRHHHIPPNQLRNYIKHDRQWGGVSSTGEPDDDFIPKALTKLVGSRAFKRYLSLYIVIMVTFWIWWFRYYTPKQTKAAASSFLMNSLKGRFEDDSEWGYFGTNKRVEFANMQHLRTLDRSLVPGSDILGAQNRRLIVIGDINGCADERR